MTGPPGHVCPPQERDENPPGGVTNSARDIQSCSSSSPPRPPISSENPQGVPPALGKARGGRGREDRREEAGERGRGRLGTPRGGAATPTSALPVPAVQDVEDGGTGRDPQEQGGFLQCSQAAPVTPLRRHRRYLAEGAKRRYRQPGPRPGGGTRAEPPPPAPGHPPPPPSARTPAAELSPPAPEAQASRPEPASAPLSPVQAAASRRPARGAAAAGGHRPPPGPAASRGGLNLPEEPGPGGAAPETRHRPGTAPTEPRGPSRSRRPRAAAAAAASPAPSRRPPNHRAALPRSTNHRRMRGGQSRGTERGGERCEGAGGSAGLGIRRPIRAARRRAAANQRAASGPLRPALSGE